MQVDQFFDASQYSEAAKHLSEDALAQLEKQVTLANRTLVQSTRRSLGQFYGVPLSRRWRVTSSVNTADLSRLATVQAETTDKTVVWYEFGTRAHIIQARNVHVLHFQSGGADVFAPLVHHPGTKPHLKLSAMRAAFERRVEQSWTQAVGDAVDAVFASAE